MATYLALGCLVAVLLLIIPARHAVVAWTRRLERSDLPDAEKVHRLQRASLAVTLVILPAAVLTRVLPALNHHADHGHHHSSAAAGFGLLTILVLIFGSLYVVARPVRSSLERVRGADLTPQARGRRFGVGMLLALTFVVVIGIGTAVTPGHGTSAAVARLTIIGLGIIAIQLVFAPVLLYSARATPMPARYEERFEHLAADMGVRVAGFKIIPARRQRQANAVQIGGIPRYRYIAVTDYLMENASDEQLDAVVAHELGHVAGHHVLKKMMLWSATWLGLQLVLLLILHGTSGSGAYAAAPILILLALYLVQGAYGVRIERHADEAATREVGPDALASALNLLGNLNHSRMQTSRAWNLLTQHPGLEQRIEHAHQLAGSQAASRVPVGSGQTV